jgi:Arc/MetJ family transcription regulator
MRTTVDLDEDLFQQAQAVTNARTKTEVIERGLRALVEQDARRRLVALRGKMPELRAVPRRRTNSE